MAENSQLITENWRMEDGFLSIDLSPMPNLHDHDDDSPLIDAVNHSVISNSDAPVVSFPIKLSDARRKWIVTQFFNLGRKAALDIVVEFVKFAMNSML
jgi:hypothetical protein